MRHISIALLAVGLTQVSATAAGAEDYYRIQTRWAGPKCYVNVENNQLQCSDIQSTWESAQWMLEQVGDYHRIKNRWGGASNCYLNVETRVLQCSAIQESWHSAQWILEPVEGYYRIKNRWGDSNCYLNVENGLRCSDIQQGWHSAQWILTPPLGSSQASTAPPTAGGSSPPGGSQEMSSEMVSAHNAARSRSGVADQLTWSAELAAFAQEWADYLRDNRGCQLEHRPRSGAFAQKYGENLYGASAIMSSSGNQLQSVSSERVVTSWESEKKDYDYGTNSCSAVCGHYTQVVWRASKTVGCAMATCPDKSQVWVCNYDPPGNFVGQKPY